MRLLLDTHYLIWLIASPHKITAAERRAIDDPDHALLISPVSIWEIRIKWQGFDRQGLANRALHPEQALAYVSGSALRLADLTGADCAALLDVPMSHRDPFDEQLLLHAQRLEAKLLTRDRLLAGHPLVYRMA